MARPSRLIPVAAALIVALAASGCGSSATTPPPSGVASPSAPAGSSSPAASAPGTAAASASGSATSSPLASAPASASPSGGAPGGSPAYESPEDLAVGDCYDPILDGDDDQLLAAVMLPCAGPHRHEVFGLVDVAGAPTAPFPGSTDLDAEAQDLCDAAFEAYVGIDFDRSALGYVYYTPTEATWLAGDRAVLCVVEDGDRPIEGSVKGAAR